MEIQYSKQAIKFLKNKPHSSWDNIEEVEPDEIDLAILKEIENDPDCHEFISAKEAMKTLGIQGD